MQIRVNGTKHEIETGEVTYQQIVGLAGLDPETRPTVVGISRVPAWPSGSPQGFTLTYDGTAWVLDGAHFTVVHTGNA